MTTDIQLPVTVPPGDVTWPFGEREYFSDIFGTEVVTNVAKPAMTYFPAEKPNGTGVVICPGGGFHALSINSEGNDVARWLNAKGVTAFVLRYRLVPSRTEDAVKDLVTDMTSGKDLATISGHVTPLAFADGKCALAYARERAKTFGIDANRLGVIGFSAGGAVAISCALEYDATSRPDFAAPIYPPIRGFETKEVPEDACPLFTLAASDDPLGLAADTVALYEKWRNAGKSAEVHLYARGGHGFGMRKQHLPSDTWIERLADWMGQLDLL
ncbi:MAG: alpha/beta hydrolase [Pseudomonadales bacterium]|nr:alpha/beta hydrolase [Pseudomonadales bacterium]